QVTVPVEQGELLAGRLAAAGAVEADPAMLELARILAGWPRLGAEVDEKTIPQEVRFDEIGGVSYTKGCYTGQETVARLHFRGRAGRDGACGGPRRSRRRPPLRLPRLRAGMTVLVTGASGLVGSHVVEALVRGGEQVRALVRPASRDAVVRLGAEPVAGDVTD